MLEGYKDKFLRATKKLSTEVNALNAQSWVRDESEKEALMQRAFEHWRYMYRYDGAYQLAQKLIDELDLQAPDKELVNRYKFHPFSEVREQVIA